MKRGLALFAAALACTVFVGYVACSSGDKGDSEPASQSRSATALPEANGRSLPELGEPLMIALAQAKNFHHKADVYLHEGQFDSAVTAVRQILSIPFPDGASEAEDVRLDARARLAKLLVVQGKTDEAMELVDAGIAAANRRSFFLANLYTVKGEVYEAMATMLDERDTEEAKKAAQEARVQAIKALDESIQINSELQKSLMGEDAK